MVTDAAAGGRPSRRSVLLGSLAGAGVLAAGAAGWELTRPEAGPTGAGAADPAGELDRYDPAAAPFFSQFALRGAVEVEQYATLAAMATAATAVVVARVRDVVVTRTIVGEGADRVGMVGLVLQPSVVRGRLAAPFAEELTVEFVGGSEPARQTADRLRGSLPAATAVWFLRAKAEGADRRARQRRVTTPAEQRVLEQDRRAFRLVSSQGFYVQGRDRVDNPMADDAPGGGDPVLAEAARFDRLSALVQRVRAAR